MTIPEHFRQLWLQVKHHSGGTGDPEASGLMFAYLEQELQEPGAGRKAQRVHLTNCWRLSAERTPGTMLSGGGPTLVGFTSGNCTGFHNEEPRGISN